MGKESNERQQDLHLRNSVQRNIPNDQLSIRLNEKSFLKIRALTHRI